MYMEDQKCLAKTSNSTAVLLYSWQSSCFAYANPGFNSVAYKLQLAQQGLIPKLRTDSGVIPE